ncbi:recombinase RecA [bacterium]|nr:recombinase RecA [bacterium]
MAKKKQKNEKGLEEALEEIKQKFGEGAIMKLAGVRPVSVDVIPTGSIALDAALGTGGVPRGRIIEIFGPESTGKTTLALSILAEAQKKGGVGAFIDAEHALDPDYAKRIGVNIDDLLISQPDSGEQALGIVESLVRSQAVDVVVVDSVAALTPKAEIEGEMDEQQIGLQARLMSKALRKLAGIVSKTKTLIVFLNQTRMKIGVMFGDPTTTSGGMALKFYSSVRIKLNRIAKIKQKDEIVASRIKAKIVKNKVASPFRTAEFDIYYNEGISKTADIINTALKYDIVKKKGGWYEFEGKKIGQGMEGAKEFLAKDPKAKEKIKEEILKKI